MATGNSDKLAERIEQILQLNLQLFQPGNSVAGPVSGNMEQLDIIYKGLKENLPVLNAQADYIATRTRRLNVIVDMLLKYTVMDFSEQLKISERGDEVDAIALGLNTLAEELGSYIGMLRERTDELSQSNEQLEQFVYIASHDLQEPLKTLTNYTNLLQESFSQADDDNARYVAKIAKATERMRLLIMDLLEYARVGQETIVADVDCNTLMHDVVTDMAASIQDADAAVNTGPLPVVQGNYSELKSLFQNLVSNAIKFRKPNEPPVVNVSATENGPVWLFAIADNGIGIEPRYHARIFAIFQKLHSRKQYQGTGIGLAHCKKVVEHHNGKIWLESDGINGSTFYFTLPKHNHG